MLGSQLSLSEICITVVFFAGSQQDPISVQSYRTSVSSFPPTLYFRMSSFLDTASISSFTIFQLLPFHDNLALPWLVLFQSRRLVFLALFPSLFELPQVPEMTLELGPACCVPALPSQRYRS